MLAALEFRLRVRQGLHLGHTTGFATGYVQANLVVLPSRHAEDFLLYCQRNPKPCPLLARGEPGDYRLAELGADLDVRTDAPRYRVFRDGALVEEVTDIRPMWTADLVAFALGCSFSFEEALLADGLEVRHITLGRNAPMFRTSIPTVAAGPFDGPMVVTMRPFRPKEAIRAIQITSRYAQVHGAPVHFGDPAAIGIADLSRPDFGDAVPLERGEVPVFWACGVTPQVALEAAKPKLCITHAPGCMLVTDWLNSHLAVI
jgi:uncharacterized protein YcsI (UPF0317 family)